MTRVGQDARVLFFLVGAGGLGRECLDTAVASGRAVAAFVDENLAGEVVRGLRVVGVDELVGDFEFAVGIADPVVRRRLAAAAVSRGGRPAQLIHPRATVAPETHLGEGTMVLGGAYISSSVVLGAHAQVQYNATLGHDVQAGDFVSIYPGANVSGSVILGDDVTVGAGAVVLQGLTVGLGALVGAGAVVTKDVAPGARVVGSPARPMP